MWPRWGSAEWRPWHGGTTAMRQRGSVINQIQFGRVTDGVAQGPRLDKAMKKISEQAEGVDLQEEHLSVQFKSRAIHD